MVSIIIPVYNAAIYLEDMLDSVLGQSYSDIEVILVNDGSKDNSSKICHKYAKKYSFVKVYDRENHGASATRNFGVEQANGDFVWFMDSDDILEEKALQTAVSTQKKYEADVVIGGMNFCFTEEKKITPKVIDCEFVFSNNQFRDYYRELFIKNYVSSLCNKLIRRSVIIDNNIRMIEKLCMYEDYIFCMDLLLKCNKVACIPDVFYNYQLRDTKSLSHRYKTGIPEMSRILQEKISEYRKNFSYKNGSADVCLNNLSIYLAYECVKNESRDKKNARKKINALLGDKDFHKSMLSVHGHGSKYRIIHILMKRKLTCAILLYLRMSGKNK